MNGTRRRLALQLTPLLDLLLIVIFAQYMEVQQSSLQVRQDLDERQQALALERDRLAERRQALDEEWAQRVASHQRQLDTASDRLARTLDLPGQLVRELTRLNDEGSVADAQRLRRASQRIKNLTDARGSEFVQMVLRVDEMQKHVSLWELHVQANGRALLSDGMQTLDVSFESRDEFLDRVHAASKSLAEPRTLVLLLLSHGDAQAGFRAISEMAMPELTARLRHDSGDIRWYDYSLLGYRQEGPVFAVPERTVPEPEVPPVQ